MIFVDHYHHLTEAIIRFLGVNDKVTHVLVGLAIVATAYALLRGRRLEWALAAVVVAECFNEVMDRLYSGSWHWPDTMGDFVATVAMPLAIVSIIVSAPLMRR